MYKFAQNTMKLDGVITEFCDVYAPVSQLLRTQAMEDAGEIEVERMQREERRSYIRVVEEWDNFNWGRRWALNPLSNLYDLTQQL